MMTEIDMAAGRKSGLVGLIVRGRRDHAWAFNMITAAQAEARRLGVCIVAYTDTPEPRPVFASDNQLERVRLPIDVRTFWCEPLIPADAGERGEPAIDTVPAEDRAA